MCGIFGLVSVERTLLPRLLEGLGKLDYRGYDSSGVALLGPPGVYLRKTVGNIGALRQLVQEDANSGRDAAKIQAAQFGMAHTRWATHGAVTEANAHPQSDGFITVVHNGILENAAELRQTLPGVEFTSQTDTEVLVHLISRDVRQGASLSQAVRKVMEAAQGTMALLVFSTDHPEEMVAARRGSPLMVGRSKVVDGVDDNQDAEFFVASDAAALASWARSFVDLGENELCILKKQGPTTFRCQWMDSGGHPIERAWTPLKTSPQEVWQETFEDMTFKEICEQPAVLRRLIADRQEGTFQEGACWVQQAKQLGFIGCGSSYYAGLAGRYWFERWAHLPCQTELASEFRYRSPVLAKEAFFFFLSQSGETLDTLKALDFVKEHADVGVMTNVSYSSMAKKADVLIPLRAGPEVSVVSTKAFTAQLAVLMHLLLTLRGLNGQTQLDPLQEDFDRVPHLMEQVLLWEESRWQPIVQRLVQASIILFLGRDVLYPIALEGALKLKEMSYLHAEGYPSGELKHGPMALIDSRSVCVFLMPSDDLFPKVLSNAQETLARGGTALFLTDARGQAMIAQQDLPQSQILTLIAPETGEASKPFVYSLLCQLLAYKVAKFRGCNVDRPRNLAKSVTVE